MLIYPQIYPHFAQVKIFPLASRARCPHSEGANSAGWGLHGIDVSNLAFVGLFCNPADAGEWSAGCYGRGRAVCRCSLKIPALPRSDFQESCRLTLSNIPKRALDYLECARIAFILPANGGM